MGKIITLIGCYWLGLIISFSLSAFSASVIETAPSFIPELSNSAFRNQLIKFIREVAQQQMTSQSEQELDDLDAKWNNYYQKTDWSVRVTLYYQGKIIGEAASHGPHLAATLKKATLDSMQAQVGNNLNKQALQHYRFKVSFDYYPAHFYSFIEFKQQGLELLGNRVAQRTLDEAILKKQLVLSRDYLLRAMHPELHGFFKFYDAKLDKQEKVLRTIYSSSSLYTLIKLYKVDPDPRLLSSFKSISDFILAMQVKDGPHAGGFYYSMDAVSKKKSCELVVGTASKTIFTLIELHKFYKNDPRYLAAAKEAGNWLLSNVNLQGKVTPITYCDKEGWHVVHKQSLLYSGQVLSALSRLYAVTKEKRYYEGASKIAGQFVALIEKQGSLVGDDYRPANSISTSWVMLSLIDFAAVNPAPIYREIITVIAKRILSRQITNPEDAYNNGRYLDAMTTSGNGWINEVMGVFYEFCQVEQLSNCQPFKKALFLTSRWLIQNAYSLENSYNIKNPQQALGGFISNFSTQTVRTDAACHGVNSLINLLKLEAGTKNLLVNLRERPLQEILPLLRAGNGFIKE